MMRFILLFFISFASLYARTDICENYMNGTAPRASSPYETRFQASPYVAEGADVGEFVCPHGAGSAIYVVKVLKIYANGKMDYSFYDILPVCPSGQVVSDDGTQCVDPTPSCTDFQYLDDNGSCVDMSVPDGMPSDQTGNGTNDVRKYDMDRANCVPGQRVVGGLGVVEVVGWDNATNKCVVATFRCDTGMTYDDSSHSCSTPPSLVYDSDIAECPYGKFGLRDYVDLCSGSVSYASVPGLENVNFLPGHRYAIYACVADYRIKKAVEVSCGYTHVDMNVSGSDVSSSVYGSEVHTTNLDDLPPIDPTKASTQNSADLSRLKNSIDSLQSSIDALKPDLQSVAVNTAVAVTGLNPDGSVVGGQASADAASNLLNNGVDNFGESSGLDSLLDVVGTSETDDILDNLADNVAYITDNITSIKEQFDNTKALITGTPVVFHLSGGGGCDENLQKFEGYISRYSAVIALITYISAMIAIFRMIFLYFSRSE